MTSENPNAEQLVFDFVEPDDAASNIPTDDSDLAVIEKSALGDDAHNLMEAIVDEVNMEMAWARVKANRGAPGPDGLTVDDFPEWFAPRWQNIRRQLLDGRYRRSFAAVDADASIWICRNSLTESSMTC